MKVTEKKYIIIKDRVEIYKDFALNLLYYIHDYYIDSESLYEDEDIRNHFKWCYKKVCDEFLKEDLDFTNNNELIEYFYIYYYHQFYKPISETQQSLQHFEKFWRNIFEINKLKNKNYINILIEIYTIYDKSINSEKNILEIA